MKVLRRVFCIAVLNCFCLAARGMGTQERISTAIDASQVTPVQSNLPAEARRATDLGPADENTVLPGLMLHFDLSMEQQTKLARLLREQEDPTSPSFHRWLSPEQFHEEFGLAPEDLQKVSDWLTGRGFTVTGAGRGGLFLRFSGTVEQANKAFHVRLHRLSLDGQNHIASLSAPQLPLEIAKVTSSITGLHDFHWKPHGRSSPAADQIKTNRLLPSYTYGSGLNIHHALVPADFYTIYDETPLLAKGINGSGIAIGILGQSNLEAGGLPLVAAFRAAAGLPAKAPIEILYGPDPGVSSLDESESLLDLQWAGAAAPGADLLLIRGRDVLDDALLGAVDNNSAPILSLSYAGCEADDQFSQALVNSYYPIFQMANAQGQTIVAGSGDQGATGCDVYSVATHGLVAEFPASSPLVTAVGGTQFPGDSTPITGNSNMYWSSTNGSYGGSALSYIPEEPWNNLNFLGGGGGASRYFTKPGWQAGVGVPVDYARDVPDISFYAANAYIVCDDANCGTGFNGDTQMTGGTSAATPIFAGVLALVEQTTGSRIGNANPTIYALANSQNYSTIFHDVTDGSNALFCTAGSTDCPVGGITGYTAGVGYDLATGWGSVDIANFVNGWSAAKPVASPAGQALSSTVLSGSASAVSEGASITLTATVAPGVKATTPTPTGSVQFLVDRVPSGAPVPLNSGVASYTLATTGMPGTHTVQAAYSGDGTFTGSQGSYALAVKAQGPPALSATKVTPATQSVMVGTLAVFNIVVSSAASSSLAAPTGSVQFLLDGNLAPFPSVLLRNGTAALKWDTSLDAPSLTPSTHTLQVSYLGDNNFAGSQGSAVLNLTVPPPDFSLAVPSTTVAVKAGSSLQIPITVTSLNNFAGNVQLTANSTYAAFDFNPLPITANGTFTEHLTFQAYTQASLRPFVFPWNRVGSGMALTGILILTWPRRRRAAGVLLLVIAALGLLGIAGCGGGISASNPVKPTGPNLLAPGTYAVTVTAGGSSGSTNVTHAAVINFVVQ